MSAKRSGPRFADIPQFPTAHYEVDVGWDYLEEHLENYAAYDLQLDPDFQRAHVWTRAQQIAYTEYTLMGGEVARNVTFNCPGWGGRARQVGPMQLVDGKQRIEAARAFMRDEFPAFGHLRSEYVDRLDIVRMRFRFRICALESRAEPTCCGSTSTSTRAGRRTRPARSSGCWSCSQTRSASREGGDERPPVPDAGRGCVGVPAFS